MENKRRTHGDASMHEITPIVLNLSRGWNQEEVMIGTLHSSFERVENYLFTVEGEQRMFTIMREGCSPLPDSMILSREDYEIMRKQKELRMTMQEYDSKIDYDSCNLLNLSVDKYTTEQFEYHRDLIKNFVESNEEKSDFERLPKKYTLLLQEFAEDMQENTFRKLVGAGRGLTPAADDAIVGVLAGSMLTFALEGRQKEYFAGVEKILSCLCNEKLTTEISCKYLKCACRGSFSQNLCELIRVLVGEKRGNILEILKKIAETGHSSGMDMLYGLNCFFS